MKILFIVADPSDRPLADAGDLWEQFADTVGSLPNGNRFACTLLADPTWASLSKALTEEEWDILHLITCTEKREGTSTAIGLLGTDHRARFFATQQLAQAIASKSKSLKIVVLQASSSRSQSSCTSPEEFVKHGVPAAICAPFFRGRTQRHFLQSFYSAILHGSSAAQLRGDLARASKESGDEKLTGICVHATDTDCPIVAVTSPDQQDEVRPLELYPQVADVIAPAVKVYDDLPRNEFQRQLQDKRDKGEYDLFLCHNAKDKVHVKEIANRLQEEGFLPWLDEREIEGGQQWQNKLSQAIRKCKAAAVCLGPHAIKGWQEIELNVILMESVDRNMTIIPLILPNAPADPMIPDFLRFRHYIDFREQPPRPVQALVSAINYAASSS